MRPAGEHAIHSLIGLPFAALLAATAAPASAQIAAPAKVHSHSSVSANASTGETANIVAQCRVNSAPCKQSVGLGVVLGVTGKCAPKDMVLPTDAEIQGVLSWLEQHPQVHPDDFAAASNAAVDALYPCSK
jgi:hypothetical protein